MIDTHAHLLDGRLAAKRDEITASLSNFGIQNLIEVGFDMPSSVAAARFAEENPAVYCAVGVHPHDADGGVDADTLLRLAKSEKCVAIGEIGLDYHYDLSARDAQKRVFAEQLALADEAGLPVVLHIREAYGAALEILKKNKLLLRRGVELHCYGGSVESVREFGEFEAFFAFGGAITFKNAKKDDVIRAVPKDRLLLETDCPYMTPVPFRGEVNQPENIVLVLKKAAEILGVSERYLDELTTANAKRFFGIE